MVWTERLATAGRAVPPLAADLALAMVLFVVPAVEIRLEPDGGESYLAPATVLLAVQAAVLVARRLHPVGVWLASGGLVSLYALAPYPDPTLQYSALVAIYTVAAHTPPRTANRAGVVTLVILLGVLLADTRADLADWLVATLSVSCAWLFGTAIRTQHAYAAELRDRAADQAQKAVADERLRLARELHDVAAHHVSVIALHAEAGQGFLPEHPERAAEAFATIGQAARSTLTELRRVLGVLRRPDGAAPRTPIPTLDELPGLVGEVQRAGLDVAVSVEGDRRPVAAAIETSAYRIVQEALTNVLRHAGPASATVRLRYEADALAVEVLDDGRGPAAASSEGHGLEGMRERVALFGGSFSAAPRPGGGFAVSARLPL